MVTGVQTCALPISLGWHSHQAASKAIHAAMKRTLRENCDELRELEELRLDDMLLAIANHVKAGNLTAIDRALKIQARRAALRGLDMPAKVELGGEGKVELIVKYADDNKSTPTT